MLCVPPPVDSFTEFEGDATQALSSTVSCAILTIIVIVNVIIVVLILPNIILFIVTHTIAYKHKYNQLWLKNVQWLHQKGFKAGRR